MTESNSVPPTEALEIAKKRITSLLGDIEKTLNPDEHRALQAWTWMHMEERRSHHFINEARKHDAAKKAALAK